MEYKLLIAAERISLKDALTCQDLNTTSSHLLTLVFTMRVMFVVTTFVSKRAFAWYLCGWIIESRHGTSKGTGPKTQLKYSDVDPDEKVDVGVLI